MNYSIITSVFVIVSGVTLSGLTPSFADDVIQHISLGHERFTLATPDPKVPMPSVVGAKYGFGSAKGFMPYVGTGIAYTLMPEIKPSDVLKLKTGMAAQAGASYQFGGNYSLNLDYKYLHIAPDLHQSDTPQQSIGIGVNIRF